MAHRRRGCRAGWAGRNRGGVIVVLYGVARNAEFSLSLTFCNILYPKICQAKSRV